MYLYELLKVHFNNVQLILSILISTGLIIPLGQFPLSLSLLSHPPSSSQTDRQLFVSLVYFGHNFSRGIFSFSFCKGSPQL